MILGVTGHRPIVLGGYSPEARHKLVGFCKFALRSYAPEKVITGMALGFDLAVAKACWELNIPFTAAVPFEGQESQWPPHSQEMYRDLLVRAAQVVYVSGPGYLPSKMTDRNCWIVDNCTHLMALYNGGTGGHCALC